MSDRVLAGGSLTPGQSITSQNGQFAFVMQNDGNLVLYAVGGSVSWVALWSSGTAGKAVWELVMQSDGNLVLYAPDERTALWASATNRPGSWLIMQNDGNLVLYEAGGVVAVWATNTNIVAQAQTSFVPSINGFHFANGYPAGTSYPAITLPVVGTIVSGDAGNGLCGGFVFAALDLFLNNPRLLPPATTTLPPDGSPIFNYLVDRLMTGLVDNGPKVVQWIQLPTHDVDIEITEGPGLSRRMAETEWPAIKADLDAGKPSPLNLVANPGRGFGDAPGIVSTLHSCHQVLATGYQLFASGALILTVYDCNSPSDDHSQISLSNVSVASDHHTIDIASPSVTQNSGAHLTVRSLFRSSYAWNNPKPVVTAGATWIGNLIRANTQFFVGQFDRAGRDDVLLYHAQDRKWYRGAFASGALTWAQVGDTSGFGDISGDPKWVGDFSGAGLSELLFFSEGDENWWLGAFTGATLNWTLAGNTKGFGGAERIARYFTGAFVSNATSILFHYPGDSNWWLGVFAGGTLSWKNVGNTSGFGNIAGNPFYVGDFTGNGRSSVVFFSPGDENWWIGSFGADGKMSWTLATNTKGFGHGENQGKFYVGRFTTPNADQIMFYHPGDRHWFLGSFAGTSLTWTFQGDTAGFGDIGGDPTYIGSFTGNGLSDVVFYSPGDRHWWIGQFSPKMAWTLAGDTSGFGNVNDGRPFFVGQFSGGGKSEIVFYWQGDGNWWRGSFTGTTLAWNLAGNTGT